MNPHILTNQLQQIEPIETQDHTLIHALPSDPTQRFLWQIADISLDYRYFITTFKKF